MVQANKVNKMENCFIASFNPANIERFGKYLRKVFSNSC